jgi:hypothetical protein
MSYFTNSLIIADVAPDAGYTRNFSYCIKINNLKQYPNYLLFAQTRSENSSIPPGAYIQIKSDRCIPIEGYRVIASITAIEKNKVQTKDLKNTDLGTVLQNTQLQKVLIKGTPNINQPHSVPIINENKQIEAIYQIQSIDRSALKLISVSSSSSQILNTILFPAIGIAILGWIMWKRQQRIVTQ